MNYFRQEEWGRIEYNPESDEFEAYIVSPDQPVAISRPLSVGVLITGRCNLKCEFCYGNDEALPKVEISPERWAQIFARLRSWGLMRVDISGGEPTMRRDLSKIVEAAKSFGLAVVVSTNGLILNSAMLGELPVTRWHVSLDSGLEEVHERSRLLPVLKPSSGSLGKAANFLMCCAGWGLRTRVLTCVGMHNREALFTLGEKLAHGE